MYAITLDAPDDFDGFRRAARSLIAAQAAPAEVAWKLQGDPALLPGEAPPPSDAPFNVAASAVPLIEAAICHRDPERFALLYELLWRLTHGERTLLEVASDPLVHRLRAMEKSVGRDTHKMTAFVRFRRVEAENGEQFIAWFEPEHHILRRVAPFFRDRFAAMRWSILTPEGTIHWDGAALAFGPGVPRAEAPADDALEAWWRTYYRATFNPARANEDLMRAQMPKKYWRNLPEAPLIPALLGDAASRTQTMVERPPTMPRKARVVSASSGDQPLAAPALTNSLAAVAEEARGCERCELYRNATQTVFGEGPPDAPVVFVGEQPGDQEDLAGRPFVGPAGQLFDRALGEAGIDRRRVYVTNAVKHFKFEPRGKRRIHAKPNNNEVDICRWWLDQELALVRPRLTVALGATAARSLSGRTVTISRERGRLIEFAKAGRGLITVHPSFLLRLPDERVKAEEYARFVQDLGLILADIPEVRATAA